MNVSIGRESAGGWCDESPESLPSLTLVAEAKERIPQTCEHCGYPPKGLDAQKGEDLTQFPCIAGDLSLII